VQTAPQSSFIAEPKMSTAISINPNALAKGVTRNSGSKVYLNPFVNPSENAYNFGILTSP